MDNCPHCGKYISDDVIDVSVAECRVTYRGVSARLMPRQTQLVEMLVRAGSKGMSRAAVYDQLYQLYDGNSLPELKILDVMTCNTRKAFRHYGVALDIVANRGWGDANFLSLRRIDAGEVAA